MVKLNAEEAAKFKSGMYSFMLLGIVKVGLPSL
jgi:hypothetical protein